jgi:hypothetical protein
MADAFRRSGGNDIARRERGEIRAKRNDLRDRIDQKIGRRALDLFAIKPRRQSKAARVRNFVGGDQPRPERPGAGKILARRHREFLIIAYAAIDEAGVAGDVLERAVERDVTSAFADHQRKLALEIEIVRDLGPNELAVMADQSIGQANEHARLHW